MSTHVNSDSYKNALIEYEQGKMQELVDAVMLIKDANGRDDVPLLTRIDDAVRMAQSLDRNKKDE